MKKTAGSVSQIFFTFLICFIVGAAIGSLVFSRYAAGAVPSALVISFSLLFGAVVFWHWPLARLILGGGFCFLLGIGRFLVTIPDCADPNQLCFYNNQQAITFRGWISAAPDRRLADTRYTITATDMAAEPSGDSSGLSGKVLVVSRPYPEYHYGDEVEMICSLRKPANKEGGTFHYDKYLASRGIWSLCSRSRSLSLLSVRSDVLTKLIGGVLAFKDAVDRQTSRLWPEPDSAVAAGLLYGEKNNLPPDVLDSFKKSGVIHVVTVSGFKIQLVATTLLTLLLALGLYRRLAAWFVLVGVVFFVVFSGAAAGAVRAGVMAGVMLIGLAAGRVAKTFRLLAIATAVMAILNPYVIVWDVGFQISLLGTLGLVYLAPAIRRMVLKIVSRALARYGIGEKLFYHLDFRTGRLNQSGAWRWVGVWYDTFIASLAATIATLPVLAYQFGEWPLVTVVTNSVIMPLIPWLMLVTAVAVAASAIWWPLGDALAGVAGLGLRYVILLAKFFGNFTV